MRENERGKEGKGKERRGEGGCGVKPIAFRYKKYCY